MSKQYDLEERTFRFAQKVRAFTKAIPKNIANQEDARQLVRSSGSIGANYIEANEALSKRDFLMRIKISRKESKESRFFLRLVDPGDDPVNAEEQAELIQEAQELTNIFGAIVRKCE